MPFTPPKNLDPQRLKTTAQALCDAFGIESLHSYQEEAGRNILKGISTLLDVPTGGGKTIAFWYPLFYYWQPGKTEEASRKIILVLGPLVALLESQAKSLNEKKIPAVAITAQTADLEQTLTNVGNNRFRVVFVGPEMALSPLFHEKVLNQVAFTKNIIGLVIDELHCITEWGNDDFRPAYRKIMAFAARLPTGVPILGASATVPALVVEDILDNLGLPRDCARIQVSNAKLNVSLVVKILQHEPSSFADLILLFPDGMTTASDFPQTLIYVNERQDAEKIQDFLRDNAPECMDPKSAFEFYHRNIDEEEKTDIQERIRTGELRGIPATDALGLGMDFRDIERVELWMRPRTFSSLVQKIGRSARDRSKRGRATLYITKTMLTQCVAELESLRIEGESEDEDILSSEDEIDGDNGDEVQDRDAALAEQHGESGEEEVTPGPSKRRRKGKGAQKRMTPLQLRDRRFLLEYITTDKCRRIPWDRFFGNVQKVKLPYPVPEGPCCDNCDPEHFEVETIMLPGSQRRRGRRKGASSAELEKAVRNRLVDLGDEIMERDWPNQHFLTGDILLPDIVVTALAKRARLITSVEALIHETPWAHASKYSPEVIKAIQEIVAEFPDTQTAQDTQATDRTQKKLDRVAFQELRARLVLVFDGCYNAVFSEMEELVPPTGRKRKRAAAPRRRCQLFLRLPPARDELYYQVIDKERAISMKNIHALSKKPTHYTNLAQYRDAWHRMFDNACAYNQEDSQIYADAVHLRGVFDRALHSLSLQHNVPGGAQLEGVEDEVPPAANSPTPPPVENIIQDTFFLQDR